MSKVIRIPDRSQWDFRQKCVFRNRPVQIRGEDGRLTGYPCIVLYEEETDIPVYYTGLERYLCHLARGQMLDEKTLSASPYVPPLVHDVPSDKGRADEWGDHAVARGFKPGINE